MVHFTDAERSLVANALVKIASENGNDGDEETYLESLFVVNCVLDLIEELRNVRDEQAVDLQGIPTAACPSCGDRWLKVPMMFDEDTYDVAAWSTEGECYSCGSLITVCTPVDSTEENS